MDRVNRTLREARWLSRARRGDLRAIRKFFGREIYALYDYAFRLSGETSRAEAISTRAMRAAASAIRCGTTPAAVRENLYAAATSAALASSGEPMGMGIDLTTPPPAEADFRRTPAAGRFPATLRHDPELARLVTQAGLAHAPWAFAAFLLRARLGFPYTTIATILDLEETAVRTLVAQVRTDLDRAIRTYVIARYDPTDCPAVRQLQRAFSDTAWTSPQRRALDQHLTSCPRCAGAGVLWPRAERVIRALVRAQPASVFRNRLLLNLSLEFFPARVVAETPNDAIAAAVIARPPVWRPVRYALVELPPPPRHSFVRRALHTGVLTLAAVMLAIITTSTAGLRLLPAEPPVHEPAAASASQATSAEVASVPSFTSTDPELINVLALTAALRATAVTANNLAVEPSNGGRWQRIPAIN